MSFKLKRISSNKSFETIEIQLIFLNTKTNIIIIDTMKHFKHESKKKEKKSYIEINNYF